MNSIERFSNKAKLYADHRLDYHPAAFEHILQTQAKPQNTWVADVGAGGGEVCRHLAGRVQRVIAIEPNANMRANAIERLGQQPSVSICAAQAEALALCDHSIDIITVGRAIHWFQPEQTRTEFKRALRPNGLLCVLRVPIYPTVLSEATKSLHTEAYGWDVTTIEQRKAAPPIAFFYPHGYTHFTWRKEVQENFDQFFGRICSFSVAPQPTHPRYQNFYAAVRQLFAQHAQHGVVSSICETELLIGKLA